MRTILILIQSTVQNYSGDYWNDTNDDTQASGQIDLKIMTLGEEEEKKGDLSLALKNCNKEGYGSYGIENRTCIKKKGTDFKSVLMKNQKYFHQETFFSL